MRAYETSLASAREAGVTALFGEKYGEFVRVLEIGNFSKELCGGTHVGAHDARSACSRSSPRARVGANLRRIEAVTSFDALEHVYGEEAVLARSRRRAQVPSRRGRREGRGAREARARGREGRAQPRRQAVRARTSFDASGAPPGAGYPRARRRGRTVRRGRAARARRRAARAARGGAVVLAASRPTARRSCSRPAPTRRSRRASTPARSSARWRRPSAAAAAASRRWRRPAARTPPGIDEALDAARALLGAEGTPDARARARHRRGARRASPSPTPTARVATPLTVLDARGCSRDVRPAARSSWRRTTRAARRRPAADDGGRGRAAGRRASREVGDRLARAARAPRRVRDERLSSTRGAAHRCARPGGARRSSAGMVDMVAATLRAAGVARARTGLGG